MAFAKSLSGFRPGTRRELLSSDCKETAAWNGGAFILEMAFNVDQVVTMTNARRGPELFEGNIAAPGAKPFPIRTVMGLALP
jgi:hypothetical protein